MDLRAPALLSSLVVVAACVTACAGARSGTETVSGTGSVEHGAAHATADRLPTAPDAVLAPAPAPAASAIPPPSESLQACIDRQLAARGRNAWGDVAGTTYPHGPPVSANSLDRYAYVLQRFPDLRTACENSTPFR